MILGCGNSLYLKYRRQGQEKQGGDDMRRVSEKEWRELAEETISRVFWHADGNDTYIDHDL